MCVCVFVLRVAASARLRLSPLTVTFPSERAASLPPSQSLHPSSPPPHPPISPSSLHPALPRPDWVTPAVLDPRHASGGLHESTIHHRRRGPVLKKNNTPTCARTRTCRLTLLICAFPAFPHVLPRETGKRGASLGRTQITRTPHVRASAWANARARFSTSAARSVHASRRESAV